MRVRFLSTTALALLLLTAPAVRAEDPAEPVIVRLAARAEVDSDCIRLADIAEISRTSPEIAHRLSSIDLADRHPDEQEQRISREVIQLRLRLAGFDSNAIRVSGPAEVVVASPQKIQITDAHLELQAQQALSAQMGLPTEDLRVALTSPVVERWRQQGLLGPDTRIELIPVGDHFLGRVNCLCRLFEGPTLVAAPSVSLNVTRRHHVLVATASLSRGQSPAGALRPETRYLATPIDELTLDQVQGKTLRLSISPGDVLTLRHLDEQRAVDNTPVIRARDSVRVTAHKGPLQVVIRDAEALQSGRIGDVIRVRNRQSGRIISARIVGPEELEVKLN